jgi:hypothetical protein
MTLSKFVATMAGVGLLRPAPGSWGSAVVLPAALQKLWKTALSSGKKSAVSPMSRQTTASLSIAATCATQ